jgi:ribonuclease HI
MNLEVFTDGGSRSNPGPSAAAFVIFEGQKQIANQGIYLGIKTNNEAEYLAVYYCLEHLLNNYPDKDLEVTIKCDSLLVVSQLSGKWKIKDAKLRKLCNEVKELEGKLNKVTYTHIPRTQNSEADLVVNLTLDEHAEL